jgi:hypothetical protein
VEEEVALAVKDLIKALLALVATVAQVPHILLLDTYGSTEQVAVAVVAHKYTDKLALAESAAVETADQVPTPTPQYLLVEVIPVEEEVAAAKDIMAQPAEAE